MKRAIVSEIDRLIADKRKNSDQFIIDHMTAYTAGLWASFQALTDLLISDNVAYDETLYPNPDHW